MKNVLGFDTNNQGNDNVSIKFSELHANTKESYQIHIEKTEFLNTLDNQYHRYLHILNQLRSQR